MESKTFSQRNMIAIIIFSVVSTTLGLVKIPGPAGSIALDSAPAFFAALFFSPIVGAFVGFIGHIGSAATAGFPFGGLHIYVALEMFIWVLIFGYIAKRKKTVPIILISGIIAALLNGIVGPLFLTITPVFNLELNIAKGLIPFLLIAATVNIALAIISYVLIAKTKISNL
jgi:riboflavin transporter